MDARRHAPGIAAAGQPGSIQALLCRVRGQGLGMALVAAAERAARTAGRRTLYLLTSTASAWFEAIGYRLTARAGAPPAIGTTEQFSSSSPGSAAFLSKRL